MNLNINTDQKYYKSDCIENGRIISSFFKKLSRNIFNQAYSFWKAQNEMVGVRELPLLFGERNLYSTVAAAVNKITPVHLSEWSFNKSDDYQIDQSRRVDIYCLYKNGNNGNPVNFFIEIKKGWYILNEQSADDFQNAVGDDIDKLVEQTRTLKKISPGWAGVDDVFLGLSIIHGSYLEGKEHYDTNNVRDNIYNRIDKRHKIQMIYSTWTLPNEMEVQWESYKCRFISIAGVVLSKTN